MFSNMNYYQMSKLKIRKRPDVLHRQTCPYCDAKLVNIYYSEKHGEYMCKSCFDIVKRVDAMDMQELLDIADSKCIEPCDFCSYSDECNHNSINCYGGNPIESPCVSDPDKWVDEDMLRERIAEVLQDA